MQSHLTHAFQLGGCVVVPELEGLEGTLQVSLLAIAPAGHIFHQFAQGLAGGLIAQGHSVWLSRQQVSRRQLRRLERQTP